MPDYRTKAERDAADRFARDVKDHKVVAIREDGNYRHVEFTAQQGFTRIVLVTWPYNLLVAGSHGSFHFERYGDDSKDMFAWLRGLRVDPASWASKLINGRDSVTQYDRSLLEKEVNERVAEAIKDKWAPKGLKAAVREEILDSHWMNDEQNALRLVSEFQHGATYRAECSCGATGDDGSYDAAVNWKWSIHKNDDDAHKVSIRQTGGFDFDGFEEWNVRKLTSHYLWACHSAVWGIARYDAVMAAKRVAA